MWKSRIPIHTDQTLRTDRALIDHDIGLRRFARTTWRGLLPRSAASRVAENGVWIAVSADATEFSRQPRMHGVTKVKDVSTVPQPVVGV